MNRWKLGSENQWETARRRSVRFLDLLSHVAHHSSQHDRRESRSSITLETTTLSQLSDSKRNNTTRCVDCHYYSQRVDRDHLPQGISDDVELRGSSQGLGSFGLRIVNSALHRSHSLCFALTALAQTRTTSHYPEDRTLKISATHWIAHISSVLPFRKINHGKPRVSPSLIISHDD